MSFLDLLLAEAIASGLARAAAEAQRPPPENFFVLPADPEVRKYVNVSILELVVLHDFNNCISYNNKPHITNVTAGLEEDSFLL